MFLLYYGLSRIKNTNTTIPLSKSPSLPSIFLVEIESQGPRQGSSGGPSECCCCCRCAIAVQFLYSDRRWTINNSIIRKLEYRNTVHPHSYNFCCCCCCCLWQPRRTNNTGWLRSNHNATNAQHPQQTTTTITTSLGSNECFVAGGSFNGEDPSRTILFFAVQSRRPAQGARVLNCADRLMGTCVRLVVDPLREHVY